MSAIPDVPITDEAPLAPVVEDDTAVEPSILGSLRAKRAKAGAGADPLYLPVPGYDGDLVLEFKWKPLKEISRTGVQLAKIKEATAQTIAAAADAVVATCSEVMVMVEGEGGKTRQPLSTNEIPVTFGDPRVSYALGFPAAPDARTTVIRAFNNEYALIDVANKVMAYLEDTSLASDEAFLGGIAGGEHVQFVAEASLHGLGSALSLLREEDPDALLALQGVNHAAAVKFDEYLQRLARYIINELGRSMKG